MARDLAREAMGAGALESGEMKSGEMERGVMESEMESEMASGVVGDGASAVMGEMARGLGGEASAVVSRSASGGRSGQASDGWAGVSDAGGAAAGGVSDATGVPSDAGRSVSDGGRLVSEATGAVAEGRGGPSDGVAYRRRVKLLRVREYQREVYESGARFKLVLCGRRWGKTTVGLAAACQGHGPLVARVGGRTETGERTAPGGGTVDAVVPGDGRLMRGALDGARIGWIAPSDDHPAAAEAWADLKHQLGPLAVEVSEQQRRIELAGGGSVRVWSGYDPDALRGTYFDGVVVDECSLQKEGVWAALRPTLSDYGGWGLLLGTVPPDVASHWFVGLHRAAETAAWRERGWRTWRRPSWENPQLTQSDLEEAKETLGVRTYLREYGAELVGAGGGVWKEEWFRFYDPDAVEGLGLRRVELFLDAAWKTGVRNDFSSCQAWGRTGTGYYLLGELHGKWESPELRRRVAGFREEWRRVFPEQSLAVVVESAGGGAVAAQELREAYDFPVVDYDVRGGSKEARNELVTPLAEGGKVWVPLASKAVWVRAWLQEVVGFPELKHDDRCDAMSMALQRLRSYVEPYCLVVPGVRVDLDRVAF